MVSSNMVLMIVNCADFRLREFLLYVCNYFKCSLNLLFMLIIHFQCIISRGLDSLPSGCL